MTQIKGNCVLITGGASGIGRIMGRMVLEKGARKLIIWDINEQGIKDTIEEFRGKGDVKGYKVDVSNSKSVEEFLLTLFTFLEELYIVYEQDVDGTVLLSERFHTFLLQGVDIFVKKSFRSEIADGH